MLTALVAHQGEPMEPHDLWIRWNADPLILLSVTAAAWAYREGRARRRSSRHQLRARCFWAGLAALVVALLSPLEALSAELASAHMVQHVLLVLVAAPLFAFSAPVATVLSGAPAPVRRATGRARHRLRTTRRSVQALRVPAVTWLLHAATLWFWHASGPYDAALDDSMVHATEHITFFATGILFWSALRPRRSDAATSLGHSALLVFTMAMQSVFLAALLTFASTPWYRGYLQTTQAWGLEPLADQQLAGVIMWVPAGLIYVAVGVLLVATWVRNSGAIDDDWGAGTPPVPVTHRSRLP